MAVAVAKVEAYDLIRSESSILAIETADNSAIKLAGGTPFLHLQQPLRLYNRKTHASRYSPKLIALNLDMKIILTLVFLTTLSGLSTFGRSTAVNSKPDSVPPQQRFHFKLASDTSPNQKLWSSVVFYPTKSPSDNEISLPLGVNQTTVRLSSGDRVLEVDEDYVFIPNANRIRVLDEDALTSQQPIRITYERVAKPVDKRIILRYRP